MTAERTKPVHHLVEKAKACLREHAHLQMQRLWCDLEDDKLVIRGQVPRFFYKQLAQEAVMHLDGPHQVVNEIEVVW